jgi:hypothetical protein
VLKIGLLFLTRASFTNWNEELKEFTKDKYAFRPAMELVNHFKNDKDYIIKLDNDLICKQKFRLPSQEQVLVWKSEDIVGEGDPRWGEKLVCETIVNYTNFMRYNIGVLGLPVSFWNHHQEYLDTCEKMIDVDISGVTDVNSKIWHCCEQTAYNWIFYKYNFKVSQTYDIFDHYFDKKINCIKSAEYLKK